MVRIKGQNVGTRPSIQAMMRINVDLVKVRYQVAQEARLTILQLLMILFNNIYSDIYLLYFRPCYGKCNKYYLR